MPFTRVSLLKDKPPEHVRAVSDGLYRALVETFEVPADDRFQVIQRVEPIDLVFDRHYLGGPRSDDYVLFDITAGKPRSTATKRAFYIRLVEVLAESPGIDPEDVMVVITTNNLDEWSFGGGRASMVDSEQTTAAP